MSIDPDAVEQLYEGRDYIDAYRAHTDLRVADDHEQAVGGRWDEIGHLQLDFLLAAGLGRGDRLLDIGCGTLRAGRLLIQYLNMGRYTGYELSGKALAYSRELIISAGLGVKRPRLVLNPVGDLRFEPLAGESYDVLLAQSVFTHLPQETVEECIAHVGKLMAPGASFYFTFVEADEHVRRTVKDFSQPRSFFEALAVRYGFELEDHSALYPHPRGMQMLCLRHGRS